MELLFKRSQTASSAGRVAFKLWGKVEFDEEEQEITSRYRFDEAVLIYVSQPELLNAAKARGFGAFLLGCLVFLVITQSFTVAPLLAAIAGCVYGYYYYHQNRETIYVRDLMHGRYFACDSVIELARKEAWLETLCAFLRQVMESAKHWDGETRFPIEALPKDEAKQIIIKGI